MEPRLSLLTLGVENVSRSRAFYEALGFRSSGPSGEDVAFFMAGGIVLSLYHRRSLARDIGAKEADARGFSAIMLAHNVRSEHEVAAVLSEAAAAGGLVIKPAHKAFWGGTIGYFSDPDGHMWEVAHNPDFPFDAAGNVLLPQTPTSP